MNFQIKRYPLTICAIVAICFLSFFNPPQTQMDNVPFIDKWVHVAMYGSLEIILCVEYYIKNKNISSSHIIPVNIIGFIAMSGTIELLQEYCTPNIITSAKRSGDWMDLLANSIGIFLGAFISAIAIRYYHNRQNTN